MYWLSPTVTTCVAAPSFAAVRSSRHFLPRAEPGGQAMSPAAITTYSPASAAVAAVLAPAGSAATATAPDPALKSPAVTVAATASQAFTIRVGRIIISTQST